MVVERREGRVRVRARADAKVGSPVPALAIQQAQCRRRGQLRQLARDERRAPDILDLDAVRAFFALQCHLPPVKYDKVAKVSRRCITLGNEYEHKRDSDVS